MKDETMLDLPKHAQFVSLKNCGHSPLIDDLQQLTFEIETFLQTGGKQHALTQ